MNKKILNKIIDGIKIGFAKSLLREYTQQLNEVRVILQAEKDKIKSYSAQIVVVQNG